MPYYPKGGYGGNKTEATGILWAQHLAILLEDTIHSLAMIKTDLKFNILDKDNYRAFLYNFTELYENTKKYMPKQKIDELGIDKKLDFNGNNSRIDKNAIIDMVKLLTAYNELLHESKIMHIIEEARVWVDSGA